MDYKETIKKIIPQILIIVGFIVISYMYFSPVLDGKKIQTHDISMTNGTAQELNQYYKETGKNAMWTNSSFGGMPAYQIRGGETGNIFHKLLSWTRFKLPYFSVGMLFTYLLFFFILLRLFKVNTYLAIAGAIAFAFSSYNIIIIAAGHVTKAYAIGLAAPVIGGVYISYRGKIISGAIITLISIAFLITAGHQQITYYMVLTVLFYVIAEFINSLYNRTLKNYFLASFVLVIAMVLAVLPNMTSLWTTYEYGKDTTRGKSELTDNTNDQTTGLDKSYILDDYSYGIGETFNLMIPNFKGGASNGKLSKDSETYKLLKSNNYPNLRQVIKQMPLYWGDQRITSGPVYIGAIVVFLFIFALLFLKGHLKWWALAATLLSIFLAWGKHFPAFSNLFIDHIPLYNKFRTVSMTLVIASWIMPLMGFYALNKLLEKEVDKKQVFNALKWSFGITGGLCLFFSLFGASLFDFVSPIDSQLSPALAETLRIDRASLLKKDAFRSFFFILLSASIIWAFVKEKLKKEYFFAGLIILILLDLWIVDKRYLNKDYFVDKKKAAVPFTPSPADQQILQDNSIYRVFNATVSTFNDASTSYFHKSIGGYHGAKLKRFQEIIERQISHNNMQILNMLNTKYFIVPSQDQTSIVAQQNPFALGNAWFVKGYKIVNNADEEMATITYFNPKDTAIIDKRFTKFVQNGELTPTIGYDSLSYINLSDYKPDELTYQSYSSTNQLAVFSEIYYAKGWKAYIDGKPADHFRVNYILRAMIVPAGKHTIHFEFKPESYFKALKIAKASSLFIVVIVLLFIIGIIYKKVKTPDKESN